MDLGLIRFIVGLLMVLIGGYLTYSSLLRFNNNFKTAERLAPVVINAGVLVLGIMVAFFAFPWWLLLVAGGLLVLGGLMRGPIKPTYR